MRYFVGCSGWRYGRWAADFYPTTLEPKEWLPYYSRVFELVEVSVPATPYRFALKRWAAETRDDFRFTVRIPSLEAEGSSLRDFLEELAPIEDKVLAVAVTAPLGMAPMEGREWLDHILGTCTYHGYSAAVEFAQASWFEDSMCNILNKHGATLVWSNSYYRPHPGVISDFLYLRLARNNDEKIWVERLKELVREEQVDLAIIVVDDPAQANSVLKLLGLPEKKYAGRPLSKPSPLLLRSREQWTGKVVMCVDLNAFYPSCEELRESALRGKPHAVIMTEHKSKITRGVVSSCSYEARRFGVRSAMPLARALALCPGLILRPVDIAYYGRISEKVMDVLTAYADVLEQASIDEAFLDCTGKIGSAAPHEYATRLKGSIKERCGLLASVGVAPCKSAAKIASDFKKPDGMTVVYPGQLREFLSPLGVGRISGIGPKTQQALKKMGIESIGQLAACDVQKLTERFGRNGLWMWKVANGADEEPVVPREESVSISTEHTLEVFAREREVILHHLGELVDEICGRIVRRGYLFRTVGVKLVRTDFSIETRETSFADPQDRCESISSVIAQLLDRFSLAGSEPAVRKVGLKVTNLVSAKEKESKSRVQRTLFDYLSST